MKGFNLFLLLGWIKALKSGANSACVEFDELAEGLVVIRDSKIPDSIECLYTEELRFFLKSLEQDVYHSSESSIKLEEIGERYIQMFREGWSAPLIYTRIEWDAFLNGLKNREFDHLISTPSRYSSYEEAMEAFASSVMEGNYDRSKKFKPLISRIKGERLKSAV